jgi:hypothetical protein
LITVGFMGILPHGLYRRLAVNFCPEDRTSTVVQLVMLGGIPYRGLRTRECHSFGKGSLPAQGQNKIRG